MPCKLFFTSLWATDNASDLGTLNGQEVLMTESQRLNPACLLLLIIAGKCIINLFIFKARQQNVSASFLGYFCISLAVVDFLHLFFISVIHYFQDFSVLGVRITSYHICLFTQIISHTYGVLHLPVFLASGLDYYFKIVTFLNVPSICLGLLYSIVAFLLWITAFIYVLQSPISSPSVYNEENAYLCTFYISKQSSYLSSALIFTIFFVLAVTCREIVSFIKSLKILTFPKNTVIVFSFSSGEKWPVKGKRFLAALAFSFVGTWGLFAILQIVILVSLAPIPAYMDMNVPWLYFMNSFLIAVALGLKYPDLQVTEKILSSDPFISWKYSVLLFRDTDPSKKMYMMEEFLSEVVAI
ncbi:putative G-protein coupled receptor 160 [Gastrophryne carolinensis]